MVSNKKEYKLSVITINFNDAVGLEKTISSVVNQKNQDFEYIVIDGFSQDTSVQVIRAFESQINYWISEPDNGIYNAMNKGIAVAKGSYCLFINSGDYLYSNGVIGQILNLDLRSDIISFACQTVTSRGVFIQTPPKEISLFTFTCGSLPHPSTLISRSLLNKYDGYHEGYRILSDWKFFLEALIIHNCSYISYEFIVSVFEGIHGISSTHSSEDENLSVGILKDHFPRIMDDYYLKNAVEFRYFISFFDHVSRKRHLLKFLTLIIRIINLLFNIRNRNLKLIKIERV